MRTPTWESSPGALAALLNSRAPLEGKADVYTVTLANGSVYRWSGAEIALQLGSDVYALGPGLKRSQVRFSLGLEVDRLTVTLTDNADAPVTFAGVPLPAFTRGRGFDNATVTLQKVFWGVGATGPVGALHWFTGFVDDIDGDRNEAVLNVASFTKWLDVKVPRDIYQTQCLNTLFDAQCGKSRLAYTVADAATSATNTNRTTFSHDLPQAAGWFSLGVITMTSGPNAGQSRTVKLHTSTQITVLQPWPFAVAAGHTFSIVPGCDKLLATCSGAKFNNRARFRGQPFIPVPETVL
jgi:uncharacterized phage protein (TIGR02218 family)